jgi:Plasmid pRiA4b ORF-3-like protein
MSSTPDLPASPSLYQLRVVLHGISPLIWRRVLIPADTTIAELHAVLQTAFGWSGEHLHRFVIHGREYGISYVGGPGFRDDARQVRLGELGLRLGERFTESGKNRGRLCGQRLVIGGVGEVGVPASVVVGEGVVEDAGADLEEEVCSAGCPAHLLLFDHAFADHLVVTFRAMWR